MNAKKIMGAVLVALLAAALFVGAGAAAATDVNGETVFVYQVVTNTNYTGTWANGANTISFTDLGSGNYALVGANIVEGAYTKGDDTIIVKYPTAGITGSATDGTATYSIVNGVFYNTATGSFSLTASSSVVTPTGIVVIGADGIPQVKGISLTETDFTEEGTYKLQAYFALPGQFVPTTPADFTYGTTNVLLGKDVFTITIVNGADPTITAVADSVIVSNTIDVVITGLPGATYTVKANGFTIPNQAAVLVSGTPTDTANIVMPNQGKVTLTLKAGNTEGDYTVTVARGTDEAEVEIEIVEGTITAAADKDAYYIGNKVTITGTSNADANVYFYIAGTNVDFQDLYSKTTGTLTHTAAVKNGEFEFEIDGDVFQNYDAGTYTVYVAADDNVAEVAKLNTYTTVPLVLKQPFISVTDAPSVAVKGTTYKVTGTAEAADDVYVYIFGTNFFAAASETKTLAAGPLAGNLTVEVKDNAFTVKAKIPTGIADMAAGQYFMVVQHPMYDTVFNIQPVTPTEIAVNTTGAPTNADKVVVDVDGRQKANAAEALCQALDSESIDDMYVKLSFVVAAPQSVINPIPTEIAQGQKLTVSGSTNVGEGEVVTVEMLSTAFAAVPKSTVGSASFISLTTKTDKDGNWEVTFDTTGLNVDEYTVTAAVNALGSSATTKVNVVEAADEPVTPPADDKPDTPVTPPADDKPTEPETPGFGALAALAGLGAVAVLLLRRE